MPPREFFFPDLPDRDPSQDKNGRDPLVHEFDLMDEAFIRELEEQWEAEDGPDEEEIERREAEKAFMEREQLRIEAYSPHQYAEITEELEKRGITVNDLGTLETFGLPAVHDASPEEIADQIAAAIKTLQNINTEDEGFSFQQVVESPWPTFAMPVSRNLRAKPPTEKHVPPVVINKSLTLEKRAERREELKKKKRSRRKSIRRAKNQGLIK